MKVIEREKLEKMISGDNYKLFLEFLLSKTENSPLRVFHYEGKDYFYTNDVYDLYEGGKE